MYYIYMNEKIAARVSGADACGEIWCKLLRKLQKVGHGKLELFDEKHNLLGAVDLEA